MDSLDIYDASDLGNAVRNLRRNKGWTQATLAAWLGVSRPTVVKLERGGNVGLDLALRALTTLGAVSTVHPKTVRLSEYRPPER